MFSVIIPTRNRATLFTEALASVLAQKDADFEVVVIDDGTTGDEVEAYSRLEKDADPRVRFFHLPHRPKGHGQSYSLNVGVSEARYPYVAFLDDDDSWTDPQYLSRVANTIRQASGPIDLHMANQAAYQGDIRRPGPIWIEDLTDILKTDKVDAGSDGTYTVTLHQLLRSHGFCHVNTLIVRRDLYQEVGGMDEGIRWECDRDLYGRLIDQAQVIKFSPAFVSRHNIPDPGKQASMTTSISMLEKRLQQLRVLDKLATLPRHIEIRRFARRHKGYVLKKITEELVAAQRYNDALWYALQALAALPTMRWVAYSLWLSFRGW